ncbi:hypothetical protein ACFYZ2_17585 [Streptomyces sviceus]|uniref:hypothetical protein n=1 Tax=Streptomyces sviceus TaxID=285530 RepID=UPI0036933FCA
MTAQARVLTLLKDIQRETGVAYLFISHDLGVVNEISDRIAVLDQGRIVEIGQAHDIATNPEHPYTRRLADGGPRRGPEETAPAPGQAPESPGGRAIFRQEHNMTVMGPCATGGHDFRPPRRLPPTTGHVRPPDRRGRVRLAAATEFVSRRGGRR